MKAHRFFLSAALYFLISEGNMLSALNIKSAHVPAQPDPAMPPAGNWVNTLDGTMLFAGAVALWVVLAVLMFSLTRTERRAAPVRVR